MEAGPNFRVGLFKLGQLNDLRIRVHKAACRLKPFVGGELQLLQHRARGLVDKRAAASFPGNDPVLFQFRQGLPHSHPAHAIFLRQIPFRRQLLLLVLDRAGQYPFFDIHIDLIEHRDRRVFCDCMQIGHFTDQPSFLGNIRAPPYAAPIRGCIAAKTAAAFKEHKMVLSSAAVRSARTSPIFYPFIIPYFP